MSKITTVYDGILTSLGTIFSEKTRIFDAYDLPSNPEHVIRDGYGIRKGGTDFGSAEFCSFRDDHGFTIVLTREVIRHDSELTPVDDQVKALLEDAFEVRERFYRFDKLGLPSDIENVTLGSVGAVETFIGGSNKFFSITADFVFQVRENLA
jgi:hypothetical protein